MYQRITLGVLVSRNHLAPLAARSKLLLSLTARKRCSQTTGAQTLIVMLAFIVASHHLILLRAKATTATHFLSNILFVAHVLCYRCFAGFLFFDK